MIASYHTKAPPFSPVQRRRDSHEQACEFRVETLVGVGRSRPYCLEPESERESVKFCRLRLRPGVAGYHSSKADDFGRSYESSRKHEREHGYEVEHGYETIICYLLSQILKFLKISKIGENNHKKNVFRFSY